MMDTGSLVEEGTHQELIQLQAVILPSIPSRSLILTDTNTNSSDSPAPASPVKDLGREFSMSNKVDIGPLP